MIKTYDTMTDLWHKTVRRMWRGTKENGGIDHVASIDTIAYSNLLRARSMEFDFDLGRDLWLTRTRWTVLVRQYLDLEQTQRFLAGATSIGLGEGKRGVTTVMLARDVTRAAKKHRWGNCMGMFTYRGLRGQDGALQPTLGLHSRVSYIAYIGGADLAVAHTLARYIARRIKVPVEEFAFEWYIDALQFHGFKSLPLLYKQQYVVDMEDKRLRAKYPTIKIVGKWWDVTVDLTERGVPLDAIKYGPHRRITRRYREWLNGEFQPSIPVTELSLEALTRR